jgi:metallophosphoesterase superfamily enzyme
MTQKDSSSSSSLHEAQSVRITIAEGKTLPTDADIVLLPGRAAFLPKTSTVVCSDIHLGKAATFRHAGMAIPEGSAQHDLQRLTGIVQTCGARRLLITGDLFQSHDTRIVLVLGNHEQSLGKKFRPHEIGINRCEEEIIEPPFRFIHDHQSHFDAQPDSFTIAGHVHPTVTIKGTSGDRLTCRCFVTTGTTLTLPAFGSFTGGHKISPSDGTRVWLAQIDGVMPLATALVWS